ncbi:MAG: hypothetical protein HZB68_05305 [Candidatus Aenigmarchaeota archaeon]|nr:hypothetical protein [Candidatus Aenigmarchaeota archaeon]
MTKEKVCRDCRRVVEGNECPICKSTDMTNKWRGVVVVIDPNSEIAQHMKLSVQGKYAIELK